MIEDPNNEAKGQVEVGSGERELRLPRTASERPTSAGGGDDTTTQCASGRALVARGLAVVGVAAWCVTVLAIGVNLAESTWEWAWIFGFGTVIPALFLWQVGRLVSPPETPRSTPSDKDKEKELLRALGERGELTPITAAIQTSLTAHEAARMLEELTSSGYLLPHVEDGLQSYALRERERRQLPGTFSGESEQALTGNEAQGLLDDPLSERELEVLALLASGRTGSEVAHDLFVTVGTVKSHTSNVYRKLGVRNRAEALTRARDLKLLS